MVVMNIDEYERRISLIELYGKLALSEREIAQGTKGEDFFSFAGTLREQINGTI